MKTRLVLLGPPACGKGTQADLLTAQFQFPVASPGAMLREERRRGTELGKEADVFTREGKFLPDPLIMRIVGAWLAERDGRFVLDGVPRTIAQAEALDNLLDERDTPLDLVIALDCPEEVLYSRMASRLMCQQCGHIVALGLHVPDAGSPCPKCGGALGRRADDSPEVLTARLREYHAKTEPLLAFYAERGLLARVDSSREPGDVFRDISALLHQA